jgi:hypothetical protein
MRGVFGVPFSAYDSDDIRLLSTAMSDALETAGKSENRPLSEIETANFSRRIAENLMRVFDSGEREPSALKRAAFEGISVSPKP